MLYPRMTDYKRVHRYKHLCVLWYCRTLCGIRSYEPHSCLSHLWQILLPLMRLFRGAELCTQNYGSHFEQ